MANVFSRLALDVHCSDFTLSVLYQTNPFCVYCIELYCICLQMMMMMTMTSMFC